MTITVKNMAINKILFMIKTSKKYTLGLLNWYGTRQKNTIMTSIRQVVWVCHARGFWKCNILGDGGFACIRNKLSEFCITL